MEVKAEAPAPSPSVAESNEAVETKVEQINWEGKIPICFELAPVELTSFQKPLPLYVTTQFPNSNIISQTI
jgi:hypothetical protein